jgi:F-type H+-transporting ATPase subunit b
MLEALNSALPVLAATETGGAGADEGGNFLVTPEVGLMIWTLLAFGVTLWVLSKFVFPRVQDALDKRQKAIEEAIEESERTRAEAQKILENYRQRLQEARQQAEEIVVRARRAAEEHERESREAARQQREELLEQTRRDIEAETRRAIQEIRNEVADLTILATEKVTRKVLSPEDQQRLVQEALSELDFAALGQQNGAGR